MKNDENLNLFAAAYEDDFKYNDENHAMLKWYVSKLIEKSLLLHKIDILSLGLGHGTVSRTLIDTLVARINRYIIVEGSQDIIGKYVAQHGQEKKVELVHGYFEDYETDRLFDVIEMGFVLEHVDDPRHLVEKYRKKLKPDGRLFIAVPNAKSLHRLIGYRAGLLEDLYQLSAYDLQLGHKRYYDMETLKDLIQGAGLKIVSIEGIFLKPITTDQMEQLHFSREIIQALYQTGAAYPEISNAILIEARNP